jgi:hypothetical protein
VAAPMNGEIMATHSRPAVRSAREVILALVFLVSAGLFIGVTAWELIVPGPFEWHIRQPQSWQGGIEALLLCAVLVAGFAANRTWALVVLVLVPAAFFARRHAFDIPLIIDLIHLEIVIGLGFQIHARLGSREPAKSLDYLNAFVTGFVAWSLFAWLASAVRLGSIQELRWLTLLLAVPALVGRRRPLCAFAFQRVRSASVAARCWYAAIAAWILVLFARTKVALGHDALWYGLQGEHVLASGHTAFESLGLVSPVHYYPKLYELWLLPLSGIGDSSIISGMTVLMLILLLLACLQLLRDARVPGAFQAPVLLLIATLPALANAAGQPKPDVFATFFMMMATISALRVVRTRSLDSAASMVACAGLACCAKLTAIPYAAAIVASSGIAAWCESRKSMSLWHEEPSKTGLIALVFTIPVLGLVLARTWILAGVPTIGPDPLLKFWNFLGFTLIEPAGTLQWAQPQVWPDVPQLFIDALFRPQLLPHIVISWTGNVWLWLAAVALITSTVLRRKSGTEHLTSLVPMVALAACGIVLFVGVRYLVRGGDGNYFLFALLPALILTASAATRRLTHSSFLTRATLACIFAFGVFQASYSFVSGSWTTGTRPFDSNFSRSWKEMRTNHQRTLEYLGLARIGERLKELPGAPRVIGLVEEPALFLLPVRYEDLRFIDYSRPEFLADHDSLLQFMRCQDIPYLIVPHAEVTFEPIPFLQRVDRMAETIRNLPGSVTFDDKRYSMIDISNLKDFGMSGN